MIIGSSLLYSSQFHFLFGTESPSTIITAETIKMLFKNPPKSLTYFFRILFGLSKNGGKYFNILGENFMKLVSAAVKMKYSSSRTLLKKKLSV